MMGGGGPAASLIGWLSSSTGWIDLARLELQPPPCLSLFSSRQEKLLSATHEERLSVGFYRRARI